MPIYLQPPGHDPRGVDGKGHNRLAVLMPMGDQCALAPTTEATFWDSMDTRKARYGNYGPCVGRGKCESCGQFDKTTPWLWGGDELVIRVDEDGRPWLMNRPDRGWGEYGKVISWGKLFRVQAEFVRGQDDHGRLIRMKKVF